MNDMPPRVSRTGTAVGNLARHRHLAAVLAGSLAIGAAMAAATAATDTRTLDLYNNHTKERLTITFKKNGRYIPSALAELNRFLRDWRRNESITMDPRLFDTVWELHQRSGSRQPIHVVCGYRSLATNNLLRSRSSAVAKHSQHTLGKAMDLNIPDVSVDKLRAIGVQMQNGGVGWYPSANSPFVHIDVGNVRAWPRLSRTQLVSLFPDGKTAHIPADGKPLPGYKEALAEIQRERGIPVTAGIETADRGSSNRGGGILAMLFGGGEEDSREELQAASDDDDAPAAPAKTAPVAARAPAAPAPTVTPTAIAPFAVAKAEPAPVVATPRLDPNPPFALARPDPTPPVTLAAASPKPMPAPGRPAMTITSLVDATLPAPGAPIPEVTVAAPPAQALALAFVPVPPARPDSLSGDEAETTVAALDVPAVLPPVKPAELTAAAPLPPVQMAAANPSALAAQAALAEVAHDGKSDLSATALSYASPAVAATPAPQPQRAAIQTASAKPAPTPALLRNAGGSASLSKLADAKGDMLGGIEAPLTVSEDGPSLLDGSQSVYWGHFTGLTHPDQRNLTPLFAAPVMTARASFTAKPYGGLVSTRFSGNVIPPNDVIEFVGDNRLAMR